MFFLNCEINLILISSFKFYFLILNLILINSSFQEVNRLFVLPFGDNLVRIGHTIYFFPTVEMKN